MTALILAAGFGVRLREIIHGRPKHLALINGQPFLRHLIKLLKKHGIKDMAISVGYLAHYIIDEFTQNDEGVNIKFSEDQRPLGTAGSLKKAQKFFKQDFFIINGDTYLDIDYSQLMKFHQKSKALLTIVATTKHKHKGSVIVASQKAVTQFIPDPEAETPALSLRNAGVYVASPKIFQYIPDKTKLSLEKEVIPQLLKTDQKVQLFPINKAFIDIGSPEEFTKAQKELS